MPTGETIAPEFEKREFERNEHLTLNQRVRGSSPRAPPNYFKGLVPNRKQNIFGWQPHGNQAVLFQRLILCPSFGIRSLIVPGQNSGKIPAASPA